MITNIIGRLLPEGIEVLDSTRLNLEILAEIHA